MLAPVATVPTAAAEIATIFAAVINPESVSAVSGSVGEIDVVGEATEVDDSLGGLVDSIVGCEVEEVVLSTDGSIVEGVLTVEFESGAARLVTLVGTELANSGYTKSPGHAVNDMSRWPEIVLATTSDPEGHLLDPRDMNETVEPGVGSIS
jgi:hypothetical protein